MQASDAVLFTKTELPFHVHDQAVNEGSCRQGCNSCAEPFFWNGGCQTAMHHGRHRSKTRLNEVGNSMQHVAVAGSQLDRHNTVRAIPSGLWQLQQLLLDRPHSLPLVEKWTPAVYKMSATQRHSHIDEAPSMARRFSAYACRHRHGLSGCNPYQTRTDGSRHIMLGNT